MSCSCCSSSSCSSCCRELLDGSRKERLVPEEEEQEEQQEQRGRRNMDLSLLRDQYRSSRETQRRRTHVLLFRTVSEELSEAVSIIPVAQGLVSPWEPNQLPPITFDPALTTFDPWRVHLDLHRRRCPGVPAPLTSSRRSSSSSEATCPNEEDRSRGDPGSVLASACHPDASFSDESSTLAASVLASPSGSTTSLHEDLNQDRSAKTSRDIPQIGSSRKSSAPVLRVTRQLSVGGVGSSSSGGVHNQEYQPFPHRKTPRISEAARRLGMYSTF